MIGLNSIPHKLFMQLLIHIAASKITKKKSICISHLMNNKGVLPLFFKKDGFLSYLPINKKLVKFIKLTSC